MDPIVSLLVAVAAGVTGFLAASRRRPAGEPPQPPSGLLEAAVAAAGDALLVLDVATLDEPGPRIVHASPAFARMSGCAPDECLGRSPRFLRGPQTDRAALDRLRKAVGAGKPARERIVVYGKDATSRWVEIDLSPLPTADARRLYVAVLRDVTREREIEDVVARGEQRLLETLNAVDMGFLVWDASDRLVFWNARYLEIFPHMGAILVRGMSFGAYIGETASQMNAMGMPDRARWVATERAARHRRFGEMFRQRASFDREIETVEFPTADGGAVAVYRDVTVLAQAQREVKESRQRLLDSIEAIGDGIVIFDRDDRVMVWNRRYVEIFPEIAPVLASGLRIEELRARVVDQARRLTATRSRPSSGARTAASASRSTRSSRRAARSRSSSTRRRRVAAWRSIAT